MKNVKKSIEGLRLDISISGNDEIAKEASKIVRKLPMYDIYNSGDRVIAKEISDFIGGKDDYCKNHFVVYDVAFLDEEKKNILKQALGETYKTMEIFVDKKKDIKQNAKKSIEGLRLDINIIGNDEIAREASKIVRKLPMYDIYYSGDRVIAKENYGFIGGKDDYCENHFVVYDVAFLDEQKKKILKQALGENYKTMEIVVDKKKDIKPLLSSIFKKSKPENIPGNTIEYYIPYTYVFENGLQDSEFLANYSYFRYPCLLNYSGDSIIKTPEAYVKDTTLITEADNAYYRIIGDKLDEIEEIIDPDMIWELVKISDRTYAEPSAVKKQSIK